MSTTTSQSPWEQICAALPAGSPPPVVAVFLTTREYHVTEKLQFGHFTREILVPRDGVPVGTIVTTSGDDVDDALSGIRAPLSAVKMLVISPHARDRPALVADARRRWPHALDAYDDEKVASSAYIFADLRPCTNTDPDHEHTPVCLTFSAGGESKSA